jgi:hypothetical protein
MRHPMVNKRLVRLPHSFSYLDVLHAGTSETGHNLNTGRHDAFCTVLSDPMPSEGVGGGVLSIKPMLRGLMSLTRPTTTPARITSVM